jgi:hypothetical protein
MDTLLRCAQTNGNGAFDAWVILGPSTTPYSINAQYAGDSTDESANAGTGFFIDEK